MQHVVVVRPFGPWRIGDVIADLADVEKVRVSEFRDHVVQIVPAQGG